MKRTFSVRLDESIIERLNQIAVAYDTKPARITEHALRIYTGLVEQNGGAMLSPAQLAQITEIFSKEAMPIAKFSAPQNPSAAHTEDGGAGKVVDLSKHNSTSHSTTKRQQSSK